MKKILIALLLLCASQVRAQSYLDYYFLTGTFAGAGPDFTNTILVKAPTLSAPWTLTLPSTAGLNGGMLTTDGTGITSWVIPTPSGNSWYYRANTGATSGYPGDGYIIWDNATQTSATAILIAHTTRDNQDIDLFLSYTVSGNKIVIQDNTTSTDNQIWTVSGAPTNFNAGTSTSYWSIPVTLVSSAGTGTTGFANNQQLVVARFSNSGGSGTVTSVGLALPASTFSISGSPVTTSGTLTGSFITQTANTFFAGPTSGGAATPAWRAIVLGDVPNDSARYILNRYTPEQFAGFNIAAGAPVKTADFTEASILNDATGVTALTLKTALQVSSTGSWSSLNRGIGLNVSGGGLGNQDIFGTGGLWSVTNVGTGFFQGLTLITPLDVIYGGTGLSSVSQGDILYASATNTLSALAKNTTASRYLSNSGTSNNPAWAQIDLTNGVTGILPVANGGTGANALTAHYTLVGNGTSAVTLVAPSTSGFVLTSNGASADPSFQAATGMSNPMNTLGDIIFENATPAPDRLAGNTTTTNKFLTQTGTGTISAAPAWNTIVAGDIPDLGASYIKNQYTAQTNAGFDVEAGAPAKTTSFTEATIKNDATSSTGSIVKTGLSIYSTGTWSGALSTNIGLNFTVTGGSSTWDIVGSGTTWNVTAAGTAGFQSLTLTNPLTVANGGTSLATLTAHSLYVGNGTSAPTALGSATNGQIPIGKAGNDPLLATITPATGATVTNGAGSITIGADPLVVPFIVRGTPFSCTTPPGTNAGFITLPGSVSNHYIIVDMISYPTSIATFTSAPGVEVGTNTPPTNVNPGFTGPTATTIYTNPGVSADLNGVGAIFAGAQTINYQIVTSAVAGTYQLEIDFLIYQLN